MFEPHKQILDRKEEEKIQKKNNLYAPSKICLGPSPNYFFNCKKKKKMDPLFFDPFKKTFWLLNKNGICATIRISREIQCLLYAGY